jgi:cell fate regulator YaaT (PSP1 superfamily)
VPSVVGVVFQNGGKIYHFDPGALELERGDHVVVQTMRGTEIGSVVESPYEIGEDVLPAPLKRVVRVATDKDQETVATNESLRKEAVATCRKLVSQHGLQMKIVDAEMAFGGGKVTFSFYSEDRVDFRALVVDLARSLKMRIELRQIGVRDEARLLGGLGPCGRSFCCTLFPVDQEPVSIRMAKEQNLPLNPMKISGLCGRLMCCLKYEQEQYVCFRKEAPRRGTVVQTPKGPGTVTGYQVAKDSLVVRLEDGSVADVPVGNCMCPGDGPCGGGPCGSSEATGASDAPSAEPVRAAPAMLSSDRYMALETVAEEPPPATTEPAAEPGHSPAGSEGDGGAEEGAPATDGGAVTHGSPVPRHGRPRRPRRRRAKTPGPQAGAPGQPQSGEDGGSAPPGGHSGGSRRQRQPRPDTDGSPGDHGNA